MYVYYVKRPLEHCRLVQRNNYLSSIHWISEQHGCLGLHTLQYEKNTVQEWDCSAKVLTWGINMNSAKKVTNSNGKSYYIVEGENYSLAPIEGCPCFTRCEWDWIRLKQPSREELDWIYETRLSDPDYEFVPKEDKEKYEDMYKKPEKTSGLNPIAELALEKIYKSLGRG